VAELQRKHLERVLRECAELGVPETRDPWPAIRERVSEEQTNEESASEERVAARPHRRRAWPPQLVPNTPLGWTLAILSVLILSAGLYAASGPVHDLFWRGLPGPAGPGVGEHTDGSSGESSSVDEERAVREVVKRFGERLNSVNPQAAYDDTVIARHIRVAYGAFVTPALLESWTKNPRNAPGSVVSSPWPEEIELLEAQQVEEGLFRVEGDVIYMSSAEIAQGGVAGRERVVLSVRKGRDGTWRISDYKVVTRWYARRANQQGRGATAEETTTDSPPDENTHDPPAQAPQEQAGLFFPQIPEPGGLSPSALGGGKLFIKNRCIYMGTRRYADVVVWPYGYSLSREGGRIYILNEKRKVVARVGEEVRMGGGEITQAEAGPTPETARRQFEEKRGELGVPDQCRGPLWVSSGVIMEPEK
jgi:hypothetical protein